MHTLLLYGEWIQKKKYNRHHSRKQVQKFSFRPTCEVLDCRIVDLYMFIKTADVISTMDVWLI